MSRGDGDTGQTTPQRRSTRRILPPAPGAPVKKRSRAASAKGTLKPKRLIYNDENQTEEATQDASDSLDSIQEMKELLEARINTVEGVWVQCDHPNCNKWRYVADVIDPSELPEKWYCSMNSDPNHNSCEAEEDSPPDDDLLEAKYFVGSIVWAKVNTYPWWPAMVDDDPDLGVYEWREHDHGLPTSYHVTFLDQNVTRAWVRDRFCMPFRQAHNHDGPTGNKIPGYYRKMFDAAAATAEVALKMPVPERIKSYCFLNNYRGTRKNLVKAPKEKGPRGRPRKNPVPHIQSSKGATLAKPRQGMKRPWAQSHTNRQENVQAEQPPSKQPKETTKQGKTAPRGRPRKVDLLSKPASTDAVCSQANEAVKRPRGRPRKNVHAESGQPADSSQEKPKTSSKKALERKYEKKEPESNKKASAKLAAPAKCTLKQPARGKLSAILSKRMIDEAKQAQTHEKRSNTNKNATTASTNPKQTTASSKPKDIAQDAGMTVSQSQAECRTDKEDIGASSEKSVFTLSTDHKSPDSQGATAFLQTTKKPKPPFKASTLQNGIEKDQGSAVSARVRPPNVTDSDNVKLQTDTETTCAPVDNAAMQAESDSHESLTVPEASNAKPLMPSHKASELKVRDSTEAGFVLSIPSFDSMETRNECYDVNSLIEFLDDDAKTDYNPMFGALNKAGQSRSYQLQLPCDPMDLEPLMDTLPIEEYVKVPGCGSNGTSQPQQPELDKSGTASAATIAEQPMPTADNEMEVHVTVMAEMGLQSSRQAEQSSEVSLGATGAETSLKVSTSTYKPPSISVVEPIESRNSEDTPAGVQKSGSPETGTCEQVNKDKGVAVTANKENHKLPSPVTQNEALAKKKKTVSKPNRAPHNKMVPPKAPPTKKPAFKVPTREATSKTEAKLSKSAAPLNGTQPRANASISAETKLQASPAHPNLKASSSQTIDAAPKAKTAGNSGIRSKAGPGKAAEANLQAALSRINGAQSKASASTATDKNAQAVPANTDETQPKPCNGYVVDSEDSDFESLSNTQDLTFDDTLSSISQSLEMSQEEDSDFASLEGIDGSQSFDMEE